MIRFVLIVVGFVATVSGLQCGHKVNETMVPWTKNEKVMEDFFSSQRQKVTPSVVRVNLDLPPEERWVHVGEMYANRSSQIIDYFESAIPKWAVGLLADIGKEIVDYRGFGNFSGEMKGYAKGLDIDLGYVVAANLVYQIERIGVNCSNWNATGPTNACKKKTAKDPIAWLEAERNRVSLETDPVQTGYCTSVVANNDAGEVLHGRNLDWNLPEEIRDLVITVEFERGGKLLYTGTTIVSFVGLLNGMRPSGFSFSMDARCQGGRIFLNLLEALFEGAMTPCHHSRVVMETATTFEEAVSGWESGKLLDDGYFIIGGVASDEGAVVSRDRNRAADTWRIAQNTAEGSWYVLETNYDHWETAPAADDRRTPGIEHMNALGPEKVAPDTLFEDVMTVWPTFNPHTDVTCIMSASEGIYTCSIWLDE